MLILIGLTPRIPGFQDSFSKVLYLYMAYKIIHYWSPSSMPFRLWKNNSLFSKKQWYSKTSWILLLFNSNVFFLWHQIGYSFTNGKNWIRCFFVFWELFLLQTSCLLNILYILKSQFSCSWSHVVAKYLQKRSSFYCKWISPGYRIFKKVWHTIVEWFEVMRTWGWQMFGNLDKLLKKKCHHIISYFFPVWLQSDHSMLSTK